MRTDVRHQVRWNVINGKLTGFACLCCAANIAHATLTGLDKGVFILRPFYVLAGWMALTGIKLMFFANPMPTSGPKPKSSTA
jgi:hypothetical protein